MEQPTRRAASAAVWWRMEGRGWRGTLHLERVGSWQEAAGRSALEEYRRMGR